MKRKNVFLLLIAAFLLSACKKAADYPAGDAGKGDGTWADGVPVTMHYKTGKPGIAFGPNGGLIYRYAENPANVSNDDNDDTPPVQPYAPPRTKRGPYTLINNIVAL